MDFRSTPPIPALEHKGSSFYACGVTYDRNLSRVYLRIQVFCRADTEEGDPRRRRLRRLRREARCLRHCGGVAKYDEIFVKVKDQPEALTGARKDRASLVCLARRCSKCGGSQIQPMWEAEQNRAQDSQHLIQAARKGIAFHTALRSNRPQATSQSLGAAAAAACCHNLLPPPSAPSMVTQAAISAPTAAAGANTDTRWVLSTDDITLYKQMFTAADVAKAGRVNVPAAS